MKTVADVLREEGFEQGIEKGRKMERERSEKIESDLRIEINKEHNEIIAIVQRLLKRNMSVKTIYEVTDIPVDKIIEIKREIDK